MWDLGFVYVHFANAQTGRTVPVCRRYRIQRSKFDRVPNHFVYLVFRKAVQVPRTTMEAVAAFLRNFRSSVIRNRGETTPFPLLARRQTGKQASERELENSEVEGEETSFERKLCSIGLPRRAQLFPISVTRLALRLTGSLDCSTLASFARCARLHVYPVHNKYFVSRCGHRRTRRRRTIASP